MGTGPTMTHDHENCDCGTGKTDDGLSRRAFAGGCGATLAFALAGTTPGAVAAQQVGDPDAEWAPLNVERASGAPINPVAVKATGGGRGRN